MAELSTGNLTIADWAKQLDPDGKAARSIPILAQSNEMLDDMTWLEGNLPTGHRTTIDTSLPEPTVRFYNQGILPQKGTTSQLTINTVNFEGRSEADKDLADLGGNVAGVRFAQARKHMEGFNQKMQRELIYGTSLTSFPGLAVQYSDLSANNADNIIDAGGTGSDNASIYLAGWGDDTVTGVFPKAGSPGLSHEDLGVGDAFDADNKRFRAYMDLWKWKIGLLVANWKYVVRISNIDISNLIAESSAADLVKLMSKAVDRIPGGGSGVRLSFYANRTIKSMLRIQALEKSNNALGIVPAMDQFGRRGSMNFFDIPIKTVDQLLNTEERVV